MTSTLVDEIVTVPDAPAIPGLRFRHWRDAADFPALYAVGSESIEADGYEVDETAEQFAQRYATMKNFDLRRDVLLAAVAGELVGFSRSNWRQEQDSSRHYYHMGCVRPAWRGRGLGRAMIRANEAHLRAIAATQPADGPKTFDCWAIDTQPGLENLLRAERYSTVVHAFDMVRPHLDDVPDLPLPPGLDVRPATPEQYRAISAATNEAFRDHKGRAERDETDYANWLAAPTFQPALWQVAWDGDEVAGMILNYINAEENSRYGRLRGYTEDISVRRPWRRRGLARALLARSLRMHRDLGMTEAGLSVESENPSGALHLYESMGFQIVRRGSGYCKPLT